MGELISIIVPVYKVEAFLEKCILSLINQSYTNLEIILVDDGSPDHCGDICDEWAKKDSRIKVIHKQNGGLSDARNAGIDIATGKYISFVDSDDWLSLDYYEILYDQIIMYNAKIAASGIVWVYDENDNNIHGKKMETKMYSAEEALETIQSNEGFFAVAWNKLYYRELFDDIRYPYGLIHEDEFVTYRLIAKAKTLTLCQKAKYFYRQRQGSIMATLDCQKEKNVLDAYLERIILFKKEYNRLYVRDKYLFCMACYTIFQLAKKQKNENVMKEVVEQRKKVSFNKKELKQFKMKEKIYIYGTKWNLPLFCKVLNWRK